MRWNWLSRRNKPLTQVRVEHTLSMDDVSEILCGWIIGQAAWWEALVEDRRPSLPTMSRRGIATIVRDELAFKGTGLFEAPWGDDITQASRDRILAWSREQCRSAWPVESAQSWDEEI